MTVRQGEVIVCDSTAHNTRERVLQYEKIDFGQCLNKRAIIYTIDVKLKEK